jgi:phosphatidate cytidylyltransferase
VLAVDPAARRKVDCAAVVIVVGYLIVLSGCAVLLLRPADGGRRVVLFMACVVAADTGAYATGVLLGRHKLAPRISPKKTWEGLAGSLVAAAVTGALLAHLFFRTPLATGALIGICLALAATAGDLAESYVKRRAGVKDMSSLLPGHGGLMDRLDSMLPAAAVALALLTALVPQ